LFGCGVTFSQSLQTLKKLKLTKLKLSWSRPPPRPEAARQILTRQHESGQKKRNSPPMEENPSPESATARCRDGQPPATSQQPEQKLCAANCTSSRLRGMAARGGGSSIPHTWSDEAWAHSSAVVEDHEQRGKGATEMEVSGMSFCTTEAYAACISWRCPNSASPAMQGGGGLLH
jgi:hypothetical protein